MARVTASSCDARAALDAWSVRASQDEAVTRAIYEAALLANMGGQLQVRAVEVPEAGTRAASVALDSRRAAFLSLPFDEAVANFRARSVVSPEVFAQMEAEARQRAFTSTLLATDALREHAYEQILAALEEGTTLRDFAASLRSGESTLGVSPSDPAYVETIFRTNIASAYGAGRLAQMQSPAVLDARPYVQFRAVVDDRTTSRCLYCNGLVFDRRTDPGWVKYAPPLHYNCRSTIVVLAPGAVSPSQVIHSSEVDPRGEPMEGFGGAPSLSLEV